MPNLVNAVPKYRKHRPTGQAVVTLNGRDFYLGPHGTKTSHSEYDRMIAEWLAAGRSTEPAAEAVTVVEIILAFMRWGRTHYRNRKGEPTGTLDNYALAFSVLKTHYGRKPGKEFGPRALEAIQHLLIQQGLSRRAVNDRVCAIKTLFKWAVKKQMVSPEVHQGLVTVGGLELGRSEAREPDPIMPVDDSVVDATLDHLPETVADMVRLQRLAGTRPAEVCIVRPGDVDTSGEIWLYRPESHKTSHKGKSRVIAFGPQGQDILRPYLLRGAVDYCFQPKDSERKRRRDQHEARVTPLNAGNRPGTNRKRNPKTTPGDRYSADSYRRAIHRGCDQAFPAAEGTKGDALAQWQSEHRWSPNQLRHSAATKIRSQFGLEAAQVTLGHSKANTTEIYAERDLAKAIEVARRIG